MTAPPESHFAHEAGLERSVMGPWRVLARGIAICAFLCSVSASTVRAVEPGQCLTSEEAELLQAINGYRSENALSPVPFSKSLTEVAQWHVWDLQTNGPDQAPGCNLHSWSDQGIWTEVCYTPDHAYADLMWSKPSEITGGVYTASGYEIAYWSSGAATAEGALSGWKASPGHDDVILNQGIWASGNPWPAMGAGILGNYAVVWFGDSTDPAGSIGTCDATAIFSDDFENGNSDAWSSAVP